MRITILVLSCILISAAPAAALQMSVTTIGATDAAQCYENAQDDYAYSTTPCDTALRDSGLSVSDRKKTLVNRGVILNRNGDLGGALDDFNAALELDPSLGEAYLNRGNAYFMSRRFDEALRDYERALEYDVSKPWAAWYNIGLVHEANKQPVKAREAFQKALSLNPDFAEARRKLED